MSDLFDLPFEEEQSTVDSPQSPVDSPQSTANSRRSTVDARPTTAERLTTDDRRLTTDRRILSVTELTLRVRDLLEEHFFEVWVEGELSNCRLWRDHLYFTLKDGKSQLRGIVYRSALRYLRFKPEDGLRVVVRGRLSVYEPKGEYQIACEHMEPQGLGALQLAFDQLKKRLQDEGLFDAGRKRPLPALPRKIGIVTSLEGAAIHDIIKVLRRRYANAHLVIRPARVQGEGAAAEIARGIQAVGRVTGVDVVIVGRGGGSIEDLWAFNEEVLARAIAASAIPVISAVGHESDITIADLVADLRAPTPSAAAELVVARKDEFCSRIDRLHDRLGAAASGRLQRFRGRVLLLTGRPALAGYPARIAMRGRYAAELTHGLALGMRAQLALRDRRLQQVRRRLEACNVGRRLEGVRTRLVGGEGRLRGAIALCSQRARARWRHDVGRLETLSPLAVLGRGYAVCWNGERTEVVRDAAAARAGDRVRVTLAKGELECEVRGTKT